MTYSIKSLIENLLSELGKNDIQYKGKFRNRFSFWWSY